MDQLLQKIKVISTTTTVFTVDLSEMHVNKDQGPVCTKDIHSGCDTDWIKF